MSSKSIWHGSSEEPQGMTIGESIVVVWVRGKQYAVDVWEWTASHGWLSAFYGGGMSISDCLRWAHERDVIERAIGGGS
jgi:hypothetical protein